MKSLLSIMLIALILPFVGCNVDFGERGDGNLVTETFDVENFNDILLRGGFEIILKESSSPRVIVTTDQNLMDLIEVRVDGDRLEINSRERLRPTDGTTVVIEYTELEKLEVAGAAEVTAENVVSGRELEIQMSGAGDIDLDLDLRDLRIGVAGAGSVELRGTVDNQEVQMSGAGGYDAEDLRSKTCVIEISGVGGASVYVTEMLDASVSGVGGVEYAGNPSDVKSSVSGMGSIRAADQD